MKKLLIGLAALPFMVSIAMAGQPKPLNDTQMDKITAGFGVEIQLSNGPINPPATYTLVGAPNTITNLPCICTGISWTTAGPPNANGPGSVDTVSLGAHIPF
jgi:hypothetical protein